MVAVSFADVTLQDRHTKAVMSASIGHRPRDGPPNFLSSSCSNALCRDCDSMRVVNVSFDNASAGVQLQQVYATVAWPAVVETGRCFHAMVIGQYQRLSLNKTVQGWQSAAQALQYATNYCWQQCCCSV